MSRGRLWTEDELLVACLFYIRNGSPGGNDPMVAELARLLNRTYHSVKMRLENFKAVDPAYIKEGRVGMRGGIKQCKPIFDLWMDSTDEFLVQASQSAVKLGVDWLAEREVSGLATDSPSAVEGRRVLAVHLRLERSGVLPRLLKETRLREQGRLLCEVCGFDFELTYGKMGSGFIEAHHKTPLHKLDGQAATTLDDLALVCSNCHRMLHMDPFPSLEELRLIWRK